jgi:hypothetical protein
MIFAELPNLLAIAVISDIICTLLLDDILLEDTAKAITMKNHLDMLHRRPLETKNCRQCQDLLLMIDGQITEVGLGEIMKHIKMLHEKVIISY